MARNANQAALDVWTGCFALALLGFRRCSGSNGLLWKGWNVEEEDLPARLSTRTSSTPAPTGEAYRSVVVDVASLPVHRLSLLRRSRPLMGVCWNWCWVTGSPFSLKKPSTRKDHIPSPKMNLNTTRVLGDIRWDIFLRRWGVSIYVTKVNFYERLFCARVWSADVGNCLF